MTFMGIKILCVFDLEVISGVSQCHGIVFRGIKIKNRTLKA